MIEVRHYLTPQGRDPFGDWLQRLRDRRGVAAILLRVGSPGTELEFAL